MGRVRRVGLLVALGFVHLALVACRGPAERFAWQAAVWSCRPPGYAHDESLAVGPGFVVASGLGDQLQVGAYDLATGRELWCQSEATETLGARLVLAGETVMFSLYDGSVIGRAAADGAERWRTAAVTGRQAVCCGVPDGVIVGTRAESTLRLRRLQATDGATAWSHSLEFGDAEASLTAAVDPTGHRLVVASPAAAWLFDATTGELLRDLAVTGQRRPPALATTDQTLYLALDDHLTAVRLDDGETLWSVPAPFATSIRWGEFRWLPALVIAGDRLLGTTLGDQAVAAWSCATGELLWRVPIAVERWEHGARALDAALFAADPDIVAYTIRTVSASPLDPVEVSVVRASDGQPLWDKPYPFRPAGRGGMMTLAPGHLILLDNERLRAFARPVP